MDLGGVASAVMVVCRGLVVMDVRSDIDTLTGDDIKEGGDFMDLGGGAWCHGSL